MWVWARVEGVCVVSGEEGGEDCGRLYIWKSGRKHALNQTLMLNMNVCCSGINTIFLL